MFKKLLTYSLLTILLVIFFSYKLTAVPDGLTIDEGAFGYNAVLISRTLHDENGRFMPVFVLSIDGRDWRQPVMQYLLVVLFWLFQPSIFILRFASVILVTSAALLLFFYIEKLYSKRTAIFTLLFFVTAPIIMIHSHLGLDNTAMLPFTLLWLLALYYYERTKDLKLLIASGVSLGIAFYSYKGMRSFVPVWTLLTLLYFILSSAASFRWQAKLADRISALKPSFFFLLGILPFYIVIPYLEFKYAGAVLGQANININSAQRFYQFMHSYLASFDPSFLFVTGDEMPHHSTGIHGMLLLASLPFFLIGLYKNIGKSKLTNLIIASLFFGPILFGFPGSVHRASRLIAIVPLYSIISGLGAKYIYENKSKSISLFLFILLALNYFDFINYYWFSYGKDTRHIFYRTGIKEAYKTLKDGSEERGLTPLVSAEIGNNESPTAEFLRSIYYTHKPAVWEKQEQYIPKGSIYMTRNNNVEGLNKAAEGINGFYFYTNQ